MRQMNEQKDSIIT